MNESENPVEKSIIIPSGTMLNLSSHEDDDYEILLQDVEAEVLGPAVNNALPIRVGGKEYFLHQPEKPASK